MKDDGLASLIRLLIDCVRKVDDKCYSADSEGVKQLIQDIDSVMKKFLLYAKINICTTCLVKCLISPMCLLVD